MLYDTQGRYTELDNLTNSINNNAATTGICSLDNKIIAFFEDVSNKTDLDILKAYKLNTIKNIVVILTGVKGDIKFLMSLIINICENWNNQFQDVTSGAYVSNVIADYIHSYTLRKNLRPLGGIILIGDTITGDIYKIGVDSTYERSKLFVVGKNSKTIETRLKSIETLTESVLEDTLIDLDHAKNLRIFKFEKTSYMHWYMPLI